MFSINLSLVLYWTFIYMGFGANTIPGRAQILVLALDSGITAGRIQETIWSSGEQNQTGCIQSKLLMCSKFLQPLNIVIDIVGINGGGFG